MDIAEEKQAQRTSGKAARRALSPEQRAAANAALCARLWQLDAVQNAQTILLYAAFGGEAGLAGFAAEAARRGKVLAYPVCGENCSLTAAVPGPQIPSPPLTKPGGGLPPRDRESSSARSRTLQPMAGIAASGIREASAEIDSPPSGSPEGDQITAAMQRMPGVNSSLS